MSLTNQGKNSDHFPVAQKLDTSKWHLVCHRKLEGRKKRNLQIKLFARITTFCQFFRKISLPTEITSSENDGFKA